MELTKTIRWTPTNNGRLEGGKPLRPGKDTNGTVESQIYYSQWWNGRHANSKGMKMMRENKVFWREKNTQEKYLEEATWRRVKGDGDDLLLLEGVFEPHYDVTCLLNHEAVTNDFISPEH